MKLTQLKLKFKALLPAKKAVVIASAAAVLIAVILLLKMNGNDDTGFVEVKADTGDIQPTVLATGTVSPENRLEIKPPIAGRIDEVLVKEGDNVKKGQMLVKMSSTERAALLDAARAQGPQELKQWETYYKGAPIMAPIDGEIIVRSAESGQTVTSSDVILVMSDRLTIKARVDETDIGSIKLNQKADVVLDAYPDDTISGKVDKIAYDSKVVSNVTTYIVDVLPDEVPAQMRSGMTANVIFYLDSKTGVICLPTNAVKIKDGQSFVLVRPKGGIGQPEAKIVKTGMSDGNNIEILNGLKNGESVLVERIRMPTGDSKKSNPFLPTKPKAKTSK